MARFFSDADSGKIGVADYYSEGRKSVTRWYEVNEAISQKQIREAINDIDNILREAVSIRTAINSAGQK